MIASVFSLPLHEPLFIITALIFVILFSPFIFRLIKIPDVAAFIIMGVLVGPHGLNILERDASIQLLGTVGLLYIMFMAGLELDPEKLKLSRKSSLIFGLATFILPFVLGILVSKYILQLHNLATLLVSIMFATHTLVAYPIVRKLGITTDLAVLTAVGGTIITDTLVLMILSVVTGEYHEQGVGLGIVKLIFLFGIYTFSVFYFYPKIARWFFKHIKRDRPVHYLFLLLLVLLSSVLAELCGTEAIIGAFIAGLALNKSIPRNSLLMHHIEFLGNVLFIPVFLISIGMLIDTRILLSGYYLWYVAVVLLVAAFAGKWLAAFLAQKILKFTNLQRKVLFGLTSSHAAATIAIILIGYEKDLIDINIFNATIIIILVSSLVGTFITEKSGKKLALLHASSKDESAFERILVPIANPANMSNLVNIARKFQQVTPSEQVYLLNIVSENVSNKEKILEVREALENNVAEFNHLHESLKVITRIDLSISSGIARAAREYMATDIVFGWSEKVTPSQKIFGTIFDHLFNSLQTLYAVNLKENIDTISNFNIFIPAQLEHEPAFHSIMSKISTLMPANSSVLIQCADPQIYERVRQIFPKRIRTNRTTSMLSDFIADHPRHLNIGFMMRKQSVSYRLKNNNLVKKWIAESRQNFLIIVPGFE